MPPQQQEADSLPKLLNLQVFQFISAYLLLGPKPHAVVRNVLWLNQKLVAFAKCYFSAWSRASRDRLLTARDAASLMESGEQRANNKRLHLYYPQYVGQLFSSKAWNVPQQTNLLKETYFPLYPTRIIRGVFSTWTCFWLNAIKNKSLFAAALGFMTNFVLSSCLVTDELLIDCLSCCRYQAKFWPIAVCQLFSFSAKK